MPFSRLSWVPFSCTLRRSAEHTSSDCIWGFSQSVLTSDSQVTSASGLSAWCCAGRAESGRTRDWLIRIFGALCCVSICETDSKVKFLLKIKCFWVRTVFFVLVKLIYGVHIILRQFKIKHVKIRNNSFLMR